MGFNSGFKGLKDSSREESSISKFTKIRPVGAALILADRQTDKHDEGNKRFFATMRTRLKTNLTYSIKLYVTKVFEGEII